MIGGRLLLALVVALILLLGVGALVPAGRVLVVEVSETSEMSETGGSHGSNGAPDPGTRLLSMPVENGTPVVLEYTHSVEKTPVRDQYTVRGDRLEMTRMTFESYGWGLPSSANISREDGQFVFDPSGNYAELFVAPGQVADHTLRVGDRSFDLVALSGGRSVRLHLVRRSVLDVAIDWITPDLSSLGDTTDPQSTTNTSDPRSITTATTGVMI